MADDREVAGIRCGAVLALLPAYVDAELSTDARAQVEAHLAGCDWCERFGGSYCGVVSTIRARLVPAPVPQGLQARLAARLAAALK